MRLLKPKLRKTERDMIKDITYKRILSHSQSLVGSRWCVTWEELDLITDRNKNQNAYTPVGDATFYLTFTKNGFVTDDGFRGLWTWKLHPGGRLIIHINNSHPRGLGCYTEPRQQEILIRLSPSERMRWIKCTDITT